ERTPSGARAPRPSGPRASQTNVPGRPINAELLSGSDLYRTVVQEKMAGARESVWIATANVKAMMVEQWPAPGGDGGRAGRRFAPVLALFRTLGRRGVALWLLHGELATRP